MKKGFNILMIIGVVAFVLSCNNNKSYTDLLKDERKAINRLIDEKDFKILKEFPKDYIFQEKEYVQLENGVYLNIIDSGNGNRPVGNETVILCRASGQILSSDSVFFNGFSSKDPYANWPLQFKYGSSSGGSDNTFMSTGFASAMDYVGDSSYVSMIVPFRVGSSFQTTYYNAIYFEKVRFTFQK